MWGLAVRKLDRLRGSLGHDRSSSKNFTAVGRQENSHDRRTIGWFELHKRFLSIGHRPPIFFSSAGRARAARWRQRAEPGRKRTAVARYRNPPFSLHDHAVEWGQGTRPSIFSGRRSRAFDRRRAAVGRPPPSTMTGDLAPRVPLRRIARHWPA